MPFDNSNLSPYRRKGPRGATISDANPRRPLGFIEEIQEEADLYIIIEERDRRTPSDEEFERFSDEGSIETRLI